MKKWTLESCKEIALQYARRGDWGRKHMSSYAAAKRNGWFDDCVAHMVEGNKQWSHAECAEIALQYSTRNEWKHGCAPSYSAASYNGWLEDCCEHMTAQHESWTLEKCKAVAAEYEVMQHWKLGHRNSYFAAYRNEWLDECCEHMIKQELISFEECKAEAAKYDTRARWQNEDRRTYKAAQRNNWSELCTAHMGDPCTVSSVETDVFNYVLNLCPDAVRGVRNLLDGKLEIDIYIPSLKLGIEYNGLEWHCDKRGKNLNYHQMKTNIARSRGIRLVHIWSDEWLNNQEVVKGYLRRLLGAPVRRIQARQCLVVPTSSAEQREFLDNNHLQGFCAGTGYALIHEGETVAVGLSRINTNNEHELVRWCVKMDTDVVGGFSKIVSRFKPGLISFCDTTKFDGVGYEGAGWIMIGRSVGIVFFVDKNSAYRVGQGRMRKQYLLEDLAGAGFSIGDLEGKTQEELAKMLGYNRVQGCELVKYQYAPI